MKKVLMVLAVSIFMFSIVSAAEDLQIWRNASTQTDVITFDNNGNIDFSGVISGDGSGLTSIASGALNLSELNYWSMNGANELYYNDANVGIGTNDPTEKLEVLGDLKVSSTSGASGSIRATSIYGGKNYETTINSINGITYLSNTNINDGVSASVLLTTAGSLRPYFDSIQDLGATSSRWKNIFSDNLYVNYDVGIGTDSNSLALKLDVEGQVGATKYCDENGLNCKTISEITAADGYIGEAQGHTAGGSLDMANNAITNINWATSDDGTGSGLDSDTIDGMDSSAFALAGSGIQGSGTTNYIPKFSPDGTTLGNSNVFDDGTNVGIGTASPGFKLEVNGTTRIDGNVGIGINPGAEKFKVQGQDIAFYSGTSTNNLYVGRNTNERLSLTVDDTIATFTLNQDESSTEAHGFVYDIVSPSTGDKAYKFNIDGAQEVKINKSGLTVDDTINANDVCASGTCLSDVASGSMNASYAEDSNLLDGYDSSFFMPLNKSVTGDFDFNGGWTDNGVSIVDGNIYAQSGYFYDINSLQVSTLTVNGSIIPPTGFDNQFDIGSSDLNWRDGYFGGSVSALEYCDEDGLNCKAIVDIAAGDDYVDKAGDTMSGQLNIPIIGQFLSNVGSHVDGVDSWIRMGNPTYAWDLKYMGSTSGTTGNEFRIESTNTGRYLQMDHDGNLEYYDGSVTNNIWHEGNDGAGSTLDADLLDGMNSSAFALAGSGVQGSGATNYIPKFTPDGTTLGNSNVFDDGANVGIGTTTPTDSLYIKTDVEGAASDVHGITNEAYRPHLNFVDRSGAAGENIQINADGGIFNIKADKNADDGVYEEVRFTIDASGHVGIGDNTPDAKLDVEGDAIVTGKMTIGNSEISTLINGDVNVW